MNQSTHKEGAVRDEKVLKHLELCCCLNQEQIHLLEFYNVSTEMSYRCTNRLEKKSKRIKRCKGLTKSEPDWFYIVDEKKPKQIEHRQGKGWIYVFLNLRATFSDKKKLIYYQDEEKKYEKEFGIRSDAYAIMENQGQGYEHIFCEYQDKGVWDKKYKTLFDDFDEDENITFLIVTSKPDPDLEIRIRNEMRDLKNVKVEFYEINQLKQMIWKIVQKQKQQKQLTGRN
jgi:hypothetical protein